MLGRGRVGGLLVAAALAACQPAPAAPHAKVAASVKASATPGAAPAPAARVLLKKPSTSVTELAGTIQMDPGYVVSVNQGAVVSNNGSSVLALSNGGVLANNGAGLVSNNGGGIISEHGGGIVAEGNQVAPAFHVLADAPPALLPAAGALVHVTSLKTGKPLPLGVDADGKPVTGVYSNATGGFKVYIDAAEAGNVLVEASVPGATDERLQHGLLTAASGQAAIDDDTDVVSRFIRTVFVARMITVLVEPGGAGLDNALASDLNDQNPAARDLLRGIVADISAEAERVHVPRNADDPAVQALGQRMVDVMLAYLGPPDEIKVSKLMAPFWDGAEIGAVDAMVVSLRALRQAAQLKLATEPDFFKTHDFVFQEGDGTPYNAKVDVAKASDLGVYMVKEFLASNKIHGIDNCAKIFEDLGAPVGEDGQRHSRRVEAANYSLLGAIAIALSAEGPARQPVMAALDDFARAQGWSP